MHNDIKALSTGRGSAVAGNEFWFGLIIEDV